MARGKDQEIVAHLMPFADRMHTIDKERDSIFATERYPELDMAELSLAEKALDKHGMHHEWFNESSDKQ